MVIERQIELMILGQIINKATSWKNSFEFAGKKYSRGMVESRYKQLMTEFLEPYVIKTP